MGRAAVRAGERRRGGFPGGGCRVQPPVTGHRWVGVVRGAAQLRRRAGGAAGIYGAEAGGPGLGLVGGV